MTYTTMLVDYYIDQSGSADKKPKKVSGMAVNWHGADKLKFAVHKNEEGDFVASEWRTGMSINRRYTSYFEDECILNAIARCEAALANGVAAIAFERWERGEI